MPTRLSRRHLLRHVPPEFARQQSSNQVVATAQAPAPSAPGSTIGGPVTAGKQAQNLNTLARRIGRLQPLSSTGQQRRSGGSESQAGRNSGRQCPKG